MRRKADGTNHFRFLIVTGSLHYTCARLFSCPFAIRAAELQFLSVASQNIILMYGTHTRRIFHNGKRTENPHSPEGV